MQYGLKDTDTIFTPALVYYEDAVKENIRRAVNIAGDVARLRPHVKSHKTVEIPKLQSLAGINKFKTATVAETEMLLDAGFKDIILAYPIVGPNINRFIELVKAYPDAKSATLAEDAETVRHISAVAAEKDVVVRLLVDIDAGMHRTGVPFDKASELYRLIASLPALEAAGLHVYDGHNNGKDENIRMKNAEEYHKKTLSLKAELEKDGFAVETVVMGGTPPFKCYAELGGVEVSPGTCFLNDCGYGPKYEDMSFMYAAVLLTRVVSRVHGHVTLDLGYKAVASDPDAPSRITLVKPEGGKLTPVPFDFIMQNEEHWVGKIDDDINVGDVMYAIPTHVCPTSALYEDILVADGKGNITGSWKVRSRSRKIKY